MSSSKTQIVEANIILIDEQEYVVVGGRTGITDSKHLIQYLRKNIKKDIIKKGKKLTKNDKYYEEGYNKYCFERYDYNEKLGDYVKSLFIVKFKTSEKSYHYETYKSIEDLIEIKRQKLKVNRARVAALLGAGIILLSVSGPTLTKGLIYVLEKDYEYDQKRYSQSISNNNADRVLTQDERYEMLENYYKDLKERAEAGDKDAQEEYSNYLAEQQLKKQIEESKIK